MADDFSNHKSTGTNYGIKDFALFVDGKEVKRSSTSIDYPTPRGATELVYDTRLISNGKHEFKVVAYDLQGTPSVTWGYGQHVSAATVDVKN